MDASHDTENAAAEQRLRWRGVRAELAGQDAPGGVLATARPGGGWHPDAGRQRGPRARGRRRWRPVRPVHADATCRADRALRCPPGPARCSGCGAGGSADRRRARGRNRWRGCGPWRRGIFGRWCGPCAQGARRRPFSPVDAGAVEESWRRNTVAVAAAVDEEVRRRGTLCTGPAPPTEYPPSPGTTTSPPVSSTCTTTVRTASGTTTATASRSGRTPQRAVGTAGGVGVNRSNRTPPASATSTRPAVAVRRRGASHRLVELCEHTARGVLAGQLRAHATPAQPFARRRRSRCRDWRPSAPSPSISTVA